MPIPKLPMSNIASSFLPPMQFASTARFDVSIDGHELGSWSKCSGLSVEFKNDRVKVGGSDIPLGLPGGPDYKAVTLSRAVTVTGARDVTNWLSEHQAKPGKCTAEITLRNAWGVAMTSWTLYGVIPRTWSGPDLEAGTKRVATETLVLDHEGFLEPSPAANLGALARDAALHHLGVGGGTARSRPAGRTGDLPRVTLTADDGDRLEFAINPNELRLKFSPTLRRTPHTTRTARVAPLRNQRNTDTGHGPNQYTGRSPTVLTMSKVVFSETPDPKSRGDVAKAIRKLDDWTRPFGGYAKALTFSWGKADRFRCYVSSLDFTITQFAADGTPRRADATIGLTEEPRKKTGQNPTSGGIGEHRTCLVIDGETLHTVAHREYGDAALWRSLATVNGVDDPLRVAPGTRLLLPADLSAEPR